MACAHHRQMIIVGVVQQAIGLHHAPPLDHGVAQQGLRLAVAQAGCLHRVQQLDRCGVARLVAGPVGGDLGRWAATTGYRQQVESRWCPAHLGHRVQHHRGLDCGQALQVAHQCAGFGRCSVTQVAARVGRQVAAVGIVVLGTTFAVVKGCCVDGGIHGVQPRRPADGHKHAADIGLADEGQ